jgi:hypothetical protein
MTMKPAVFEISDRGGLARLLCVNLTTLGEAVRLEEFLSRKLPQMHVRLLGRFDQIEIAPNLAEFMEAATSAASFCESDFEVRMRRVGDSRQQLVLATGRDPQLGPSLSAPGNIANPDLDGNHT